MSRFRQRCRAAEAGLRTHPSHMFSLSVRKLAIGGAVLLASAGLGLAISHRPEGASAAPGRYAQPNIVLVMTDDQTISQTGPRVMPQVNKLLRDRGTSFPNAFLTTPLCCPSRATLLTGQYGHNNGVLRNTYHLLRQKRNVLPVWLRRAGYVTAHVGKFLNRYHHRVRQAAVAPGWDQWYTQLDRSQDDYYDWDLSRNGRRVHYGHRHSDYAPRVFERSAVRVVRRFVPRRKPLYLEVDEIAPHPGSGGKGTGCANGPVPDPRDVGKFENAQLPRPPSFNEADMSDKPSFLRTQPAHDPGGRSNERTRKYRCGLASLQQVDRTVGHLTREFKRLGELGKTVFIFYTDNGLFFGEHRVRGGKIYPYEEADRTPLFIRLPARYRKGHPRVPRGSRAGGEHRPGADDPRPGPRAAVCATGSLPSHGRQVAAFAAARKGAQLGRRSPAGRRDSASRRQPDPRSASTRACGSRGRSSSGTPRSPTRRAPAA